MIFHLPRCNAPVISLTIDNETGRGDKRRGRQDYSATHTCLQDMDIRINVTYRTIVLCSLTSDGPHKAKTADAPERRCSSRTFRYGYLVTT